MAPPFNSLLWSLFVFIFLQADAHFVLQLPPSLGFNDVKEGEGPCGSFSINNRDKVTEWPVGGYPISLLTTHTKAKLTYWTALANSTDKLVDLIPQMNQMGVGDFCLPTVPGKKEWVGQDAVVQIVQEAADGSLYQCAAVKFTDGDAAAVPSSCKNSTGVQATFIVSSGTPSSTKAAPTGAASRTRTGQFGCIIAFVLWFWGAL
ncbi:uncharacterized protein BDR25DRAFT_340289 [Lindgomyces ingoldianus]|uniref:Uncharacterized protein n=1 Tax=Lindgomyces ingoldianus TaxID=673940 RepID=A0ACB6RB71_9PLEO|nr:uncharacterized protein BDR25DRAFT_340289 [Lindgomyces ingoldianus]KAF2475595.1 hypothetical protein BDR25DRAFT_340289 [Lindgomyces ingoldianus]